MLQETKELLKGFYGLDDETFKLSEDAMNDIKHKFDEIKEIREYNQYKVLKAMQEANLSDNHFNWTTGYGYNDLDAMLVLKDILSHTWNSKKQQ